MGEKKRREIIASVVISLSSFLSFSLSLSFFSPLLTAADTKRDTVLLRAALPMRPSRTCPLLGHLVSSCLCSALLSLSLSLSLSRLCYSRAVAQCPLSICCCTCGFLIQRFAVAQRFSSALIAVSVAAFAPSLFLARSLVFLQLLPAFPLSPPPPPSVAMAAVDPILEVEAELQGRRRKAPHDAAAFCSPPDDVDTNVSAPIHTSKEKERKRDKTQTHRHIDTQTHRHGD